MYLRTTPRRNKDGSVVRYVQLAHNVWDPARKRSRTQVIYSFGRAEDSSRAALERLAGSLSRFLSPDGEIALPLSFPPAAGGEAARATDGEIALPLPFPPAAGGGAARETEAALLPAAGAGFKYLGGRPLGGTFVLDALWRRLGIDALLRRLLEGRRRDPAAERVLFALVANRALAPSSKLAAAR